MSLINDALRKAQADVIKGPVKPIPLGPANTHQPTKNKGSLLLVLSVVLVIGLAGWGVALFFSKSGDEAPAVAATTVPEPAAAPDTASESTPPVAQAPQVEASVDVAVEQSVPEQVAPEPVSAPVTKQNAEVAQSTEKAAVGEANTPEKLTDPIENEVSVEPRVVASIPAVPPAAAPPAEAKPVTDILPSDEIVYFLKHMEITAVMGDGKNARIMMDGQIHRAGELVDLNLKIRLYGKKGTTLYFTDEQGKLYEKKI